MRYTEQLMVRVSTAMLRAIRAHCEGMELTTGEFVRLAVKEQLKRDKYMALAPRPGQVPRT
jgi:hypothetical protein